MQKSKFLTLLEGTVDIVSSDGLFIERHVRSTKVPLKHLSWQNCFFFHCSFAINKNLNCANLTLFRLKTRQYLQHH